MSQLSRGAVLQCVFSNIINYLEKQGSCLSIVMLLVGSYMKKYEKELHSSFCYQEFIATIMQRHNQATYSCIVCIYGLHILFSFLIPEFVTILNH